MLLHPEQTRRLIAHAVENHYAVLAVQADSPAAISDVLLAAEAGDAPVILEVTTSTLSGHGCGMGNPLLGVNRYLAEVEVLANSDRFRNVPVACQVNG
ncbi:MAG: fructose-bisphosphate aldolase class II, partial [Verrucomicrobiales bacterium]